MTAPPADPNPPAPSPQDVPPGRVELAPGAWMRESDLSFTFSRSSGPGGQNVNKVATRAELRVNVEDIVGLDDDARDRLRRLAGHRMTRRDEVLIAADTSRSQATNRAECIKRLSELVARALVVPRRRIRKRPTRAMIERRLQAKRERSQKKDRRRWRPE